MAHPHDAMADEPHRLGPLSTQSGRAEYGAQARSRVLYGRHGYQCYIAEL